MTGTRTDVSFDSNGDEVAAWLYTPEDREDETVHPGLVMAAGFGGTREGVLEGYAERFAEAGLAVLLFDYRHFGASGGEPRQLLDVKKQLEDWRAALAWLRSRPEVDEARIVLWGSSFSGGHVQTLGAEAETGGSVAAIISQVPFCDGRAAAGDDVRQSARLIRKALKDVWGARRGKPPVYIPLVGEPGDLAVMTSPDAMDSTKLNPEGSNWRNRVAARVILQIPNYRPGRRAGSIRPPILYSAAELDLVTRPGPIYRVARAAPNSALKRYPVQHFDIYTGEAFETAIKDQLVFLARHLQIPEQTRKKEATR